MSKRRIHILVGSHTQHHTDITKEGGDDDTLDDDEPQDAPRLRADGLADAKLVGALLDGDEHDVADTHNA